MSRKVLLYFPLLCLVLSGCAYMPSSAASLPILTVLTEKSPAAAEPSPRRIAFPDGSFHYDYEIRADLTELKHEDVAASIELLRQMPQVHCVDLGQGPLEEGEEPRLSWEDIASMQEAFPGVEFLYRFRFFGYDYTTLDRTFDLNHIPMDDEGAAVREILPCMQYCNFLDMDFCNVSSQSMAQIRDDFPQIEVVWRVWFGLDCSVRTDVDHILASNLSHRLGDHNTSELQYCTRVKYLDVGHNTALTDFSFLRCMPDLEVAVLSITGLNDLSQLENCTKLEYLEICNCGRDMDLTPLAKLKNLHHLNMNYLNNVTGYKALCELTELERLWIGACTHISEEDLAMLQKALPNTEIDIWDTTGCSGTWRYTHDGVKTERYALLCKQFEYDRYPYSCSAYTADKRYYAKH